MTGFHFPHWRRELEQAIARAEPLPIRILLDEIEREHAEATADLADLSGDAAAGEPAP